MPFVPPEHHGRLIVMALMVYAGDIEAGERAVAPFRKLATPVADMIRAMPYPEIFFPDEPGFHPIAAGRTMFVDTIGRDDVGEILERLQSSTAMAAVTQIRVLGRAMARVPDDATAFAHRRRAIMVNLGALFEDPGQRELHEEWVEDFMATLQVDDPAAYVNFLGDEGEDRVRQAYPQPTWNRLAEIKGRYDPTNLFRSNHNVPPAVGDSGEHRKLADFEEQT